MKKKYTMFWISAGIIITCGFIILLIKIILPIIIFSAMQGNYTKTGIENYSPYNSLGLTRYFTLFDETEQSLFEQYEYENISYRHHYLYKGNLQHDLEIVVVKYSDENFNIIKEDIISNEYYGDHMCTYQGYDFHFNEAYVKTNHKFEYFDFDSDAPFLRFMNCVGINSEQNSLVFIGFYYTKQKWISGEYYDAYDFVAWDIFFEEFFPEISSE